MKKICLLVICMMLALTCIVHAENGHPTSLEAPKSFNLLESDTPTALEFRFSNTESIIRIEQPISVE